MHIVATAVVMVPMFLVCCIIVPKSPLRRISVNPQGFVDRTATEAAPKRFGFFSSTAPKLAVLAPFSSAHNVTKSCKGTFQRATFILHAKLTMLPRPLFSLPAQQTQTSWDKIFTFLHAQSIRQSCLAFFLHLAFSPFLSIFV